MSPQGDWRKRKAESDVFLPMVRHALAPHVILVSTDREDREEGTDLVVLRSDTRAIGVRIRRVEYLRMYPHDLTIRTDVVSGRKTELDKLVEGYIDALFYGFGDYGSGRLAAYRIVDCRALRAQMIRGTPPLVWTQRKNVDGMSSFRAFDVRSFAEGVQIGKWSACHG